MESHRNRTLIQPIDVQAVPRLALTREELAESLGVSDRTIWQMTQSGALPHVRLGAANGRVVYPIADVQRWLAERARKAAEPQGDADKIRQDCNESGPP